MPPVYRIVPIVFDTEKWQELMRSVRDEDVDVVAGLIGCASGTVKAWRSVHNKQDFPHPSMHNFLKTCNALDLNPQEFFILDETEK